MNYLKKIFILCNRVELALNGNFVMNDIHFKIRSNSSMQLEEFRHFFCEVSRIRSCNIEYELCSIDNSDLYFIINEILESHSSTKSIHYFIGEAFYDVHSSSNSDIRILVPKGKDASKDHLVVNKGNKVTIVHIGKPDNDRYLLRCARELYLRTMENRGGFMFHASGLAFNDLGFLAVGEKGAGKSSLAAAVCFDGIGKFIANDRVIITHCDENYTISPFPLSCRLSFDTLAAFSNEDKAFIPIGGFYRDQVKNAESYLTGAASSVSNFDKFEFTPKEWCSFLGCELPAKNKLSGILFPSFNMRNEGLNITSLDIKHAKEILYKEICTPYDGHWIEPWLLDHELSNDKLEAMGKNLVNSMVSSLPCIKINFGPRYGRGFNFAIQMKDALLDIVD